MLIRAVNVVRNLFYRLVTDRYRTRFWPNTSDQIPTATEPEWWPKPFPTCFTHTETDRYRTCLKPKTVFDLFLSYRDRPIPNLFSDRNLFSTRLIPVFNRPFLTESILYRTCIIPNLEPVLYRTCFGPNLST